MLSRLASLSENDNPSPVLLTGASGLGQSDLALQAARNWASGPVEDYSQLRIVMGKSSDDLSVRDLRHSLSLKAVGRRAILLNLTGASLEVQNALLKSLEDTPALTWLLLIAEDGYTVLPTVRSRCAILHFSAWDEQSMSSLAQQESLQGDLKLAAGNPSCLRWINDHQQISEAASQGNSSLLLQHLKASESAAEDLRYILNIRRVTNPSWQLSYAQQMLAVGAKPELVLACALLV